VKRILALFAILAFASCGSPELVIPDGFTNNYKSGVYEFNYPDGWKVETTMSSLTIVNTSKTVSIPVIAYPFAESKKGDLTSIKELSDAAVSGFGKNGIPILHKPISGVESLWIEVDAQGDKLVNFYLPMDGSVISCMTLPTNQASTQDIKTSRMIVETFRLISK
jgi:hypothetical protein